MATATSEQDRDGIDKSTQPPFLRRVRIQGYKSIALCDVSLQPLTILVGRNGSGKSNFLDSLAFLRDAVKFNLPEAVKRRGGLQSILCRSAATDALAIEIEAAFQIPSGREFLARYRLTIRANGGRGASPGGWTFPPHEEQLQLQDVANACESGFRVAGGWAEWFGYGVTPADAQPFAVPSGHLFLSRVPDAPAAALAEELAAMGLYDVNPEAIRRLQKPLSGVLLERNGSNLASAIQGLEDIEPECLARVRDYLAAITEDVQGFHAVRYGEYETVRFLMRSKSAETPMELDAASMSNGTLRALAALVAAFQVYEPTGHPSVVGIEEPETSLHPGASGALVDAVQEATGRTQILLTTHSADLLGDRDVKPFHVLVVRMRDGQTQIAPVDAASREIIRKELYTLADLQRMNQLEPDEADLERQANSKSVDEER